MPGLPVPATRCRCLDALGTACSLQRRRGLSVLRRPAHGPWRFKPSSGLLGHGQQPWLPTKQAEQDMARNSRPGAANVQRLSTLWSLCPGQGRRPQSAGGRKPQCTVGPNLEYQVPEVSIRQRRASGSSSRSFSAVAALRSCRLLAQPGPPNPSVKGTSRKRAAPYVER
jgi:hypothetical protein